MSILALVYAVVVLYVLVRPSIGPFSRQFQLIWESKVGKLVIIGIFIVLLLIGK